jgi:hypothetical protein
MSYSEKRRRAAPKTVPVERRPITTQRPSPAERARVQAPVRRAEVEPPPKRGPTRRIDGDIKQWISRGFSPEVARAMAEQASAATPWWSGHGAWPSEF